MNNEMPTNRDFFECFPVVSCVEQPEEQTSGVNIGVDPVTIDGDFPITIAYDSQETIMYDSPLFPAPFFTSDSPIWVETV